MNLGSLQHLVRSVRTLAKDCQVVVLGSASLLASFPELGDGSEPLAATYDADLCPQPFDETTALLIHQSLGESGPFHLLHGYHVDVLRDSTSRPCLSARGNDSSRFPTVTEQAHWIRTIWPPQSCSSDAPRTSPSFAISPRPGECPASLSSTVSTPSLRPTASSSPPAWLSARPLTLPARFNHSSSKYRRITTALS